jgi:hypothetical protein
MSNQGAGTDVLWLIFFRQWRRNPDFIEKAGKARIAAVSCFFSQ